ncbi:MAG: hypothetical protein U0802_17980 [Candidatus Binatia bacterium]
MADGDGPVIPPGQEQLLLAMLGRDATLPGGCALADGRIEHTTVEASYTCGADLVEIRLSHPTAAPDGATETERFAVARVSGTAPPGLTDALAAKIREREGEFTWVWPDEVEPAAVDDAVGARFAPDEPRW